MKKISHVLTFDIEDWFHIVDIPELEDRKKWSSRPSIVESKTDLILSMLDNHQTKATFFILGWIAEKYPKIIKKIASEGHEIASHSYWHRRVDLLSKDIFREDTKKSIDILQQQTGKKIKGYRAPTFSITPGTEWAFGVLVDLGIEYDASLFPMKRGHGGYPCPERVHRIQTDSGSLIEIPMTLGRFGSIKLPFTGGGYLRTVPTWFLKKGFENFEKRNDFVIVYLHPRDFAPNQPSVKMPLIRKFKSYVGLKTSENKLNQLLCNYKFQPCCDFLKNY